MLGGAYKHAKSRFIVKLLVLGYDGARNASTVPDGLKYEDWRKSKDRESDGQNSGTS
jgi:hypothetical protein